jgi:hypothetical protein
MHTFRGFDYNGGIYSISSKMDVNNDGINDLLVGFGDRNSFYTGKVLCYMGGSDFDTIPDYILEGSTHHHFFGSSIVEIGDFTGNGNKEIVIGQLGINEYVDDPSVLTYGKVFIYTFGEYSDVKEKTVPAGYHLKQNYPNPFNPVTNIQFSLPEPAHITLNIYNITGRLVEQLVNQHIPAGYHTVTWDASRYSSGIYIALMQAGDFVKAQKMVLMK